MQILFLVALVPCFIYYLLKGTKTLHMLQQNWYNEGNRYIRWILENKYKVFIDPDMFFVIFIFSIFTAYKASLALFVVFYSLMSLMFIKRKKLEQVKKPLAYTKRVKRIIVTEILLFLIPGIIFSFYVSFENLWVFLLLMGLLLF